MNTPYQYNNKQYLIRYTIKGGWSNIEEVVIPATCASVAERIFVLFDFLLTELPERVRQRPALLFQGCAEAYGWFCLAVLSGESIYVQYAENYAFYLKEVLSSDDAIPTAAEALAGLYRPDRINAASCGFNRLIPGDPGTLHEAEQAMAEGQYEDFLSDAGRQKYEEYAARLDSSPGFRKDLELLQASFPAELAQPIVRRTLLLERNWQTGFGATFDNNEAQFQAIFDLFCWKWYLWGLAGDTPLLLKPSTCSDKSAAPGPIPDSCGGGWGRKNVVCLRRCRKASCGIHHGTHHVHVSGILPH